MEKIFNLLLVCHIIFGFSALVSALLALTVKKGALNHRRFGTGFFVGMSGVFVTALPMAYLKSLFFLLVIAIFSYYMAFSGWRFAKNRSGVAHWVDKVAMVIMGITAVVMIGYGGILQTRGESLGIALIVFGIIGGVSVGQDIFYYLTQSGEYKLRISRHLSAMCAGTIAAMTAFSVTNIHVEQPLIVWLAPTVIFVPIIAWWNRRVLSGTK